MLLPSIHFIQHSYREARVWSCLSHNNVVPFFGLCRDLGLSLAMISPLYDNGHVFKYLNKNPQVDRLAIVSLGYFWREWYWLLNLQIIGAAHGLKYIHANNVVHGNPKGVEHFLVSCCSVMFWQYIPRIRSLLTMMGTLAWLVSEYQDWLVGQVLTLPHLLGPLDGRHLSCFAPLSSTTMPLGWQKSLMCMPSQWWH